MTITKQRVEEIISRIEMYGHGAGYTGIAAARRAAKRRRRAKR